MLNIPEHVSFCRVEGDFVLMDVAGGHYFALDAVASEVWEKIAAGAGEDRLVDHLVERYGIRPERARRDVGELIEDLVAKGLLTRAE